MTLKHSSAGFTLIELMVVVVIVAVLLIVALPAYQNQVLRGHRGAAKAEMLELADREQQFLLANRRYAEASELETNGYALEDGVAEKYTYAIALSTIGVGLPRYTITFTPIAGTIVDKAGEELSLNSEGETPGGQVGALIPTNAPQLPIGARQSQRGALMIEVLVTIVVVVIGVLGLMEMHSRLQQSEMESYQRTQAMMLVNDMASRISTNRYNALKYATDSALVGYGMNCAGIGSDDIAADDSTEWCLALQGAAETDDSSGSTVNVGAMLGGRGCVSDEDANTLFRVTVVWQGLTPVSAPPAEVTCGANLYDNSDTKCIGDRCRRYVTTLVRVAGLGG